MLKSTYKAATASLSPLPEGWTEHKAPTGHPYYHNTASNVSTYTRPQIQCDFASNIAKDADTILPYPNNLTASKNAPLFSRDGGTNGTTMRLGNLTDTKGSHFRDNRSSRIAHHNGHRSHPRDKPKSKHDIPGCKPWLLVKTKLGRRFVYNPELDQSFWKFPTDIMKGVIAYDRVEGEALRNLEEQAGDDTGEDDIAKAEAEYLAVEQSAPTAAPRPLPVAREATGNGDGSDDEYEEVEITDDEDDASIFKKQRTECGQAEEPVEFNEDDIAYQLEAMGHDYGLDPGEYGNDEKGDLEEGAEGLPLTDADSKALFRDMLEDYRISPYITWEALIEVGQIIEDDRYTVLPNMRSRREVWSEWSKDKIQHKKKQREKEEKKDPKIPYFAFLQARATPKLYWPEFRRKYLKEPEMRNTKLTDKDREKWFREYINRLKLPEVTLRADLVELLKSIPLHTLNRATSLDNLPIALLTDVRFISLRSSVRDGFIEAHISTLPPSPENLDISLEEASIREVEERERRERALAQRQKQVQEERRKQEGALRHSKVLLTEGEQELAKAMHVRRDGLLSHMEE